MSSKILNWLRFRTPKASTKRDPYEASLREFDRLRSQQRNSEASQVINQLCDSVPPRWDILNKAAQFEADIMGDLPKATELNKRALAVASDDLSLSTIYRSLGAIYQAQGQLDISIQYYLQALELRKRIYGEEHAEIALSCNHIGGIYHAMGMIAKAHEFYRKALEINIKLFGEKHPSVASNYNNGGILYYEQGDYERAIDCYQKSLDIKRLVFGEEHGAVATAYFNIGAVRKAQGRYEEALDCFRRALEIRHKLFGDNAFLVGTCYDKIGHVLQLMGRNAEALEAFQSAYDLFSRNLGEIHPETMAVAKMVNDLQIVVNKKITPPTEGVIE